MGIRIEQADAAAMPLDDESVQLIVTSPPYNLGKDYGTDRDQATLDRYLGWTERWLNDAYRVLAPSGRLCVNIPLDTNLNFEKGGKTRAQKTPFYWEFSTVIPNGFTYNTTIVWLEENVSRRTAWGSWLSASDPWVNTAVEMVLVLSKGDRKRVDGKGRESDIQADEFKDWTLGIWRFSGENRTKSLGHPSPFPEELPRRLITLFSFIGDTVLDPFVGSGTTALVADRLRRNAIGFDINAEYCENARIRCAVEP